MSSIPNKASGSKRPILPFVAFGCGGLFLLAIIVVVTVFYQVGKEQLRPVDKNFVLVTLAGVPIYPKAKFDEEATQKNRAGLVVLRMNLQKQIPVKLGTVAAFRTTADPVKEVLPYYDQMMASYGFVKSRVGADLEGSNGATYGNQDTTVIVRLEKDEPGEDHLFLIFRFDTDKLYMLGNTPDVVKPEDFDAVKKKEKEKAKSGDAPSPSPSPSSYAK